MVWNIGVASADALGHRPEPQNHENKGGSARILRSVKKPIFFRLRRKIDPRNHILTSENFRPRRKIVNFPLEITFLARQILRLQRKIILFTL